MNKNKKNKAQNSGALMCSADSKKCAPFGDDKNRQQPGGTTTEKYYAAMYLRLSKEDGDCEGGIKTESNSISNQRELIRSFIKSHPEIELYDVYIDDGYTGSNFDRPDFKRMTTDVEAGRVNCVIVKDLSRFGRDYIEAGRLLQKVYPALQVRFIAIGENYDSLNADVNVQSIMVPIHNFINDSYCRDISIKTKSARRTKCEAGEFISAFAAYGYKKDEKDKNHLVVDAYASQIVKNIYYWKIMGYSSDGIAKKLNGLGILSPAEYKKSKGMNYVCPFSGANQGKWSSKAIHRILTNRMYLGHMVQAKSERINYKINKQVKKPEQDWICVENTHEAIISQDEFEIVQNLLQADFRQSPSNEGLDLFAGILYCGDCKERMIRRKYVYGEITEYSYICSSANRSEGCRSHRIDANTLTKLVETMLFQWLNNAFQWNAYFETVRNQQIDFSFLELFDEEISRAEKEKNRYYKMKESLFFELGKKVITQEEYDSLSDVFEQRIKWAEETIEKQRKNLHEMYARGVMSVKRIQVMQNALSLGSIDRYMLCCFVKRIYVYENNRIEIEFYFQDQMRIIAAMHESCG